jgi:hypothetical protein
MSSDWLGWAAVVPGDLPGGEQHSNPRKHNLRNLFDLKGVLVRLWTDRDVIRKSLGWGCNSRPCTRANCVPPEHYRNILKRA